MPLSCAGDSVSNKGSRNSGGKGAGRALSIGFEFAVGIAVFTFGGYWLDQKAGGGQRWTLTGFGLGVLYAAYELWKAVQNLQQGGSGTGRSKPGRGLDEEGNVPGPGKKEDGG